MSKIIAVMVFIILAAGALSGCASASSETETTAAEPEMIEEEETVELTYPITLKTGYSTSEDDPRGAALRYMKEIVEKETGGNIIIDIHPSAELGDDDRLIAGLISADVDMTVSSAGNYAIYATRIGVSALPFLFDSFEEAWNFIDSDTMQDLCSELEPYNMHVLAFFDNGFRCVTTSDRPVESVSDIVGLNIRTPDNQIVMETMSQLGANPRTYPFSKLKTALKYGWFDAQENPVPVIYNNGLYDYQKYLSVTNHSYDAMPLTIRADIWNALAPEYQTILESAAKEAQAMNRKTVAEQSEECISLLEKKGMTVTYPNLEEFAEATQGVIHVFSDVYGKELLSKL